MPIASDFVKLTKLANINHVIATKMNTHINSNYVWKNNTHLIFSVVRKIQNSAEQGNARIYLPKNDPFWHSPDIHEFFVINGFKIDDVSIGW
jgi:hypothetical protein